jgi:hypothetical protein
MYLSVPIATKAKKKAGGFTLLECLAEYSKEEILDG